MACGFIEWAGAVPLHRSALLHGLPTSSKCPCARANRCARLGRRLRSTDSNAGDSSVQNRLEDMLRLQIDKEELKQMVLEEGAKLRQTADEAREELEKLEELARARSDLAFGNALADINKSADEFEEQLRASRERMEADQAAFAAWERQTAVDRSAGHFFQSLYQSDKSEPVGSSLPSGEEAAAKRKQRESESRASEMRQAVLRLFVCASLAVTLACVVCVDAQQSESPAYALDALYTLLSLGFMARAGYENGLYLLAKRSQTR